MSSSPTLGWTLVGELEPWFGWAPLLYFSLSLSLSPPPLFPSWDFLSLSWPLTHFCPLSLKTKTKNKNPQTAPLTSHSHIIKYNDLQIQWFLVYSQNCTASTTVNVRTFLPLLAATPYSSSSPALPNLPPSPPPPLALGSHFLCLQISLSWTVTGMEIYLIWSFVSGWFQLA